jgi:hypothetical protein
MTRTHVPLAQEDTTLRIDKSFTSKWLRAADIEDMVDEDTQTAIVAVDRVAMEEIGQDEQQKPVLYFKGIDAGMVLNKTNANTLMELLGKETDDWTGKSVGLFTQEVDFQGKQVLAIRVRMKLPKKAKATTPVVDELEIPF